MQVYPFFGNKLAVNHRSVTATVSFRSCLHFFFLFMLDVILGEVHHRSWIWKLEQNLFILLFRFFTMFFFFWEKVVNNLWGCLCWKRLLFMDFVCKICIRFWQIRCMYFFSVFFCFVGSTFNNLKLSGFNGFFFN